MTNPRQRLLDAAIQLLAVNPRATLAEIAEAAGVQRVTLHRHFGSRDELMRDIALDSLAQMDRASVEAAKGAKSHTAALRSIVEALVPVADRFRFLWQQQAVWSDSKVADRVAKDNQELLELIEQSQREGGIAPDIPAPWVLSALEALVFAAQTTSQNGDIAVNDAGRLAVRTLFDGIAGPKKKMSSRRK